MRQTTERTAELVHWSSQQYEGAAIIVEGHGIPSRIVAALASEYLGDGSTEVDETHLAVTRCKWCSKVDGWGCDSEGDWHRHWSTVQPHEDARFSVIWLDATPRSPSSAPVAPGADTEGGERA